MKISPVKAGSQRVAILTCALLLCAARSWAADIITYGTLGSNTWTCPVGVTNVQVECWGGGGTGASARRPSTANGYGGGGGGGAYAKSNVTVTAGSSYTIYVGGGGFHTTATIAATGVAGAPGTNSWFGTSSTTNALAAGGNGAQDSLGNSSSGGTGGTTAASIGATLFSGGAGQVGGSPNGGGGGSSAGTGANGNNATTRPNGATAPTGGGNGGTAGNATSPKTGSVGSVPGGGGGGAVSTGSQQSGGDGAAGQVKLTYTVVYDRVNVETAANGSGSIVAAQNVSAGSSITNYAIGRGSDNSFMSNAPATWTLINKSGGVVDSDLVASGDSKSAVFTAHLSGSATIRAVIGTATTNASGLITVPSTGVNATWNVDADGNWSASGNWSGGVPSAAGDTATLGVGTGLRTVTLDASESLGGLSFTNANSFVISGANTLTMDNSANGAALVVNDGTANAIQSSVALNDNTAVTVGSGKTLTLSSVANTSTAKTLGFGGAGTTILSSANTYGPASAGTTGSTLSGGTTVQLGNNGSLGAGDVSVTSSSGTLRAGVAALSLANNIAVGSGATVTVDNNGNSVSLGGVVSGSGALAKTGSGTLTLSGVNTYSNSTTIGTGTLSIASDSNLGTAPGSATTNSLVLGSSTSGLLVTGTTTLAANRGVGLGATSGSTGSTGLIDVAASQIATINGIITSAGNTGTNGLTFNSGSGTGTAVLGGANTFNGTTLISAGTLKLANSLALQSSTLNYSSGTLSFGSLTTATLGGLSGSQNLSLLNDSAAAVALTVGGNSVSNNYSGGLSGTSASLTKSGTATFTLSGNNTYTGNTTVSGGTLEIAAGGSVSCAGVFAPSTTVRVSGGSLTASANSTLGVANTSGGTFNLQSGSATFNAGLTGVNQDAQFINITGGTFTSTDVTLNRAVAFATAPTATAPVSGSTSGGMYINSATASVALGTLSIGIGNSSASVRMDAGTMTASGKVLVSRISGGSTRWSILHINGGTFTSTDTANGIVVAQNNATACNGEVYLSGGSTNTAEKIAFGTTTDTLGGNGFLIVNNASLYLGSGGIAQSNTTGFTTTISLLNGTVGAKADWSSSLGMQLSGTSFTLQAADASSVARNITLSGALSGAGALVKSGGGTLTLGGVNIYAGTTTVSNGTLRVDGSLGAGATAVKTGATLGGGGTVAGVVTVESGGTLAPGASIGTLTLSSAPALGGTLVAEINRNGGSPLADKIICNGGATLGGTLTVTNIGAAAQNGDTFDLFDGSVSGTFTTINLPPGGLNHWKTNNLVVDGTITFTNNAPVATNISIGCTLGDSVSLQVLGGKNSATDADGDSLTITSVGTASSGTSGSTSSNVTYTANGTTGTHAFSYTVTDSLGATDTKTVTVTVSSAAGYNQLSAPVNNGNGTFTLGYLGIPGLNYALDESPDLVAPFTWYPVLTNTASGTGAITYTVPLSYPSGSFRTRYVP